MTLDRIKKRLRTTIVGIAAVALLAAALPAPAKASVLAWTEDTTLQMNTPNVGLTIAGGSKADSLDIYDNQFTLTVGAGDKFTAIWKGPSPGYFVYDGGLRGCLYIDGNNQFEVLGPKTTTVSLDATTICGPPGGGGGGGSVPSMVINNPYGSQVMNAGDLYSVTWTASGFGLVTIRLSLSTDEGATWTVIAQNEQNDGVYSWLVPNVDTDLALIKGEVISSTGSILKADTSNSVFTINPYPEGYVPPEGAADPFIDPNVTGSYDPQSALNSTTTINSDKGLTGGTGDEPMYCQSGSLIKASNSSAVYYCGANGKRYVFPNERIYFSWYEDFSTVITITPEDLAMIPLGGNVTYRPGERMVKIQSDPKVYAIARGGILRWVTTEAVAEALYGPNWNQFIDDVNVAFFLNYTIGEAITEADVGL